MNGIFRIFSSDLPFLLGRVIEAKSTPFFWVFFFYFLDAFVNKISVSSTWVFAFYLFTRLPTFFFCTPYRYSVQHSRQRLISNYMHEIYTAKY